MSISGNFSLFLKIYPFAFVKFFKSSSSFDWSQSLQSIYILLYHDFYLSDKFTYELPSLMKLLE